MNCLAVYPERPSGFTPVLEAAASYCECAGKFLLLKRSVGKPQGNTWGLPAGKLERDETAHKAVLRETFEETGIQLEDYKLQSVGKVFVRYSQFDFVFHMFYQEFSNFPSVLLSDEHQDYRWLTFEQALEKPLISGAKEVLHYFQIFRKKARRFKI